MIAPVLIYRPVVALTIRRAMRSGESARYLAAGVNMILIPSGGTSSTIEVTLQPHSTWCPFLNPVPSMSTALANLALLMFSLASLLLLV
jgi:hypothetical protein